MLTSPGAYAAHRGFTRASLVNEKQRILFCRKRGCAKMPGKRKRGNATLSGDACAWHRTRMHADKTWDCCRRDTCSHRPSPACILVFEHLSSAGQRSTRLARRSFHSAEDRGFLRVMCKTKGEKCDARILAYDLHCCIEQLLLRCQARHLSAGRSLLRRSAGNVANTRKKAWA